MSEDTNFLKEDEETEAWRVDPELEKPVTAVAGQKSASIDEVSDECL